MGIKFEVFADVYDRDIVAALQDDPEGVMRLLILVAKSTVILCCSASAVWCGWLAAHARDDAAIGLGVAGVVIAAGAMAGMATLAAGAEIFERLVEWEITDEQAIRLMFSAVLVCVANHARTLGMDGEALGQAATAAFEAAAEAGVWSEAEAAGRA